MLMNTGKLDSKETRIKIQEWKLANKTYKIKNRDSN